MAYIEIKDATKWYPHKSGKLRDIFRKDKSFVKAVDGVNLSMDRGEILGVIGESGCGKSLTAMALMRLLPEDAQVPSGTVTLAGRELLSLTEKEMECVRGAGIAVIFQEPATSFNPVMMVGESGGGNDPHAFDVRTHGGKSACR